MNEQMLMNTALAMVKKGKGIKEEIASMPGQYRYSIDILYYNDYANNNRDTGKLF